jgi:shikimate dehydrogenase
LKFDIAGKNIVILGAGGAAKAVTNQLARKKAKTISIYDIDKNKCLQLVNKLNREFPECSAVYAGSIEKLDIKNSDLLINATPIGMKESDSCLIDENQIHKGLLVYDLIYNPGETKLLALAKEKGAQTSNGLGMLLYQGALSFQIWTGVKKAPVDIMRKKLMEGIKK